MPTADRPASDHPVEDLSERLLAFAQMRLPAVAAVGAALVMVLSSTGSIAANLGVGAGAAPPTIRWGTVTVCLGGAGAMLARAWWRRHSIERAATALARDAELARSAYDDRRSYGEDLGWLSSWVHASRTWEIGLTAALSLILGGLAGYVFMLSGGAFTGITMTAATAGASALAGAIGLGRRGLNPDWRRREVLRAAAVCPLENVPARAAALPGGEVLLARLGMAPGTEAAAVARRLADQDGFDTLEAVAAAALAVTAPTD